MEFATLNQLLTQAVKTYQKPDALSYKKDGTWHRISSEEWLARAPEHRSGAPRAGRARRRSRGAPL